MGFLNSLLELVVTALIFHFATFAIGMIPLVYYEKWKNIQAERVYNEDGHLDDLRTSSQASSQWAQFIFKYMSNFGMGMLIGTSFMLVIPEGVYSVLESKGNLGFDLLLGFIGVYLLDSLLVSKIESRSSFDSLDSVHGGFDDDEEENMGSSSSTNKVLNVHAGVKLNSVWDCINVFKTGPIILQNNVVFALVIHGLSDGVSLGAAATSESLKFVMYVAIIIHKIPAVLSLSSLMISKQKLSYYEVVTNLWAFALSTPIGYIIIALFCMSVKDSEFMGPVAANLLLVSGGSLLYAAFTAFSHNSADHSTDDEHHVDENDFFSFQNDNDEKSHQKNVLSLVVGATIPMVVAFIIKE